MVRDGNDTDFAGDAFGAPGEIAGVEAEAAVFGVAASGADEMYSFGADTGVGWLTALLESSAQDQNLLPLAYTLPVYLFFR